jgi:hypothetical protein
MQQVYTNYHIVNNQKSILQKETMEMEMLG